MEAEPLPTEMDRIEGKRERERQEMKTSFTITAEQKNAIIISL